MFRTSLAHVQAYRSSYVPQHADEAKLNHNEAFDDVSPALKAEVLRRLAAHDWRRYPDPHAAALRCALASRTRHPAEGIVIGNGGNDLIEKLMVALDHNCTLVLAPPDYYLYGRMAAVLGVQVRLVPLKVPDFALDLDGLLDGADERTVLALSWPNNPTGVLHPRDDMLRLLRAWPGLAIVDEAYVDFSGATLQAELMENRRLVLVRTFSKAFALAGLRLGYLLAHPDTAVEIEKVLPPYPLDLWSQVTGLVALERAEEADERAQATIAAREALAKRLQTRVRVAPSATNFLLLEAGERKADFLRALAELHVVPRDPGLPGWVRISVGTPSDHERVWQAACRVWP